MRTVPGREQFLAAENLVFETDAQERLFAHGDDDGQVVIVDGGTDEFRRDLEYWDAVAVGLELAVGETLLAEQLRARDLEPRQVVGVIDDAHHVGLGVADRNRGARLDHASASGR